MLLLTHLPGTSPVPRSSHSKGIGFKVTVLTLAPSPLLEHALARGSGEAAMHTWEPPIALSLAVYSVFAQLLHSRSLCLLGRGGPPSSLTSLEDPLPGYQREHNRSKPKL